MHYQLELLLFLMLVLLPTTAPLPGRSPEAFVLDKNFQFMFRMLFFSLVVPSPRVESIQWSRRHKKSKEILRTNLVSHSTSTKSTTLACPKNWLLLLNKYFHTVPPRPSMIHPASTQISANMMSRRPSSSRKWGRMGRKDNRRDSQPRENEGRKRQERKANCPQVMLPLISS